MSSLNGYSLAINLMPFNIVIFALHFKKKFKNFSQFTLLYNVTVPSLTTTSFLFSNAYTSLQCPALEVTHVQSFSSALDLGVDVKKITTIFNEFIETELAYTDSIKMIIEVIFIDFALLIDDG